MIPSHHHITDTVLPNHDMVKKHMSLLEEILAFSFITNAFFLIDSFFILVPSAETDCT